MYLGYDEENFSYLEREEDGWMNDDGKMEACFYHTSCFTLLRFGGETSNSDSVCPFKSVREQLTQHSL